MAGEQENSLVKKLRALQGSEIMNVVRERLEEFKKFQQETNENLFKELCFCLLTANCSAQMCISVQESMGDLFITIEDEADLAAALKDCKYRFYNRRAHYIMLARRVLPVLRDEMKRHAGDERAFRDWLVENVKGLGMKEASHFMRNVGFENVAIIDFHVVDILVDHGIVEKRPKTMTRKVYLDIEGRLEKLAARIGVSLAALDLMLWYLETGKILK